jgi:hypothetical protein
LNKAARKRLATSAIDPIIATMADKHPKRPRDFSQAAKLVVDIASGQVEDREPTPEEQGKDPAAIARGHLGGIKGGSARAANMTAKQRSDSARNAARKRWGQRPKTSSED